MLLQVSHAENRCKPLNLATLLSSWNKARTGAVTTLDYDNQGTGLALKLISEISEEVCSQLHSGIMKTARKVLLDEIVGFTISDSLASKKAQKNSKIIPVNEPAKSFPSPERVVITQTSKKIDQQPENPDEKDHAIGNEVVLENTVESERCYGGETVGPPPRMKSIGTFENFCAACTLVSRAIFCSCLEVMWNAIAYDPVADHSSAWRKKKLWYSPDYVVEKNIPYKDHYRLIEKPPADSVCIDFCHIFFLRICSVYFLNSIYFLTASIQTGLL